MRWAKSLSYGLPYTKQYVIIICHSHTGKNPVLTGDVATGRAWSIASLWRIDLPYVGRVLYLMYFRLIVRSGYEAHQCKKIDLSYALRTARKAGVESYFNSIRLADWGVDKNPTARSIMSTASQLYEVLRAIGVKP